MTVRKMPFIAIEVAYTSAALITLYRYPRYTISCKRYSHMLLRAEARAKTIYEALTIIRGWKTGGWATMDAIVQFDDSSDVRALQTDEDWALLILRESTV